MRTMNFARRNFKELIRDPLSLIFAIALPLFLLFIFQQFNIPSDSYKLENFTPGIVVFGFSFITLFTAMLISKDRGTSLLIRLGTSPMRPAEYIAGYMISILPIIILQAIIMGLKASVYIILAILASIVVALPFIALGILIGSVFSEKASSGISSIVIQLVCFTSGMYFPKELIGEAFAQVCEILPFESCVNIIKGIANNDMGIINVRNLVVFAAWTIVILIAAVVVFKRKMTSDNK